MRFPVPRLLQSDREDLVQERGCQNPISMRPAIVFAALECNREQKSSKRALLER